MCVCVCVCARARARAHACSYEDKKRIKKKKGLQKDKKKALKRKEGVCRQLKFAMLFGQLSNRSIHDSVCE